MNATNGPLVVGADGSGPSLDAVDWAVETAALWQVPLRIVYGAMWQLYDARRPTVTTRRPSGRVFADNIVATAAERAARCSRAVKVTGEVLAEDPAVMLTRLSEAASAVVVGARGHGEFTELLLGSVGLSVAAHAKSPVVVVRGAEKNRHGGYGSVAVGVDDPVEAGPAVAFAFREAQLRGVGVTAVHAWRCPAADSPEHTELSVEDHRRRAQGQLTEALRDAVFAHPEVRVRSETREDRPSAALVGAATVSDLLVVGARRRAGHFGMQLGPVNHAVLHLAGCPVAVVPHA